MKWIGKKHIEDVLKKSIEETWNKIIAEEIGFVIMSKILGIFRPKY